MSRLWSWLAPLAVPHTVPHTASLAVPLAVPLWLLFCAFVWLFFCDKGLTYTDLAKEMTNPRLLYKQTIHPSCPDGSLAVMGFARPAFGSIPPCSEMQSRLHAMVLSGHKTLPCPEDLRAICKKDQANW